MDNHRQLATDACPALPFSKDQYGTRYIQQKLDEAALCESREKRREYAVHDRAFCGGETWSCILLGFMKHPTCWGSLCLEFSIFYLFVELPSGMTCNKPAVQAPEETKHRVYAAGILGAVELCQRGCQNRRDYVWQYFCIQLLVCPAPNCLIGSD